MPSHIMVNVLVGNVMQLEYFAIEINLNENPNTEFQWSGFYIPLIVAAVDERCHFHVSDSLVCVLIDFSGPDLGHDMSRRLNCKNKTKIIYLHPLSLVLLIF